MDVLDELYLRPGYLIRRAHQMAVSTFMEYSDGMTPTQYGVLTLIGGVARIDQIGIARRLGLDRSTAGLVVGKLVDAGLVARQTDAGDQRRYRLRITRSGRERLAQLAAPVAAERARLLSPFSADEAAQFLALLQRFVDAHNAASRVPHLTDVGA
ncbi:MAG TPA: MarR family transcriptional regulator [Candidatus Sulfotelmatobacter sp.]|nr:MarR family transcriptional regulator [Candidatus Sulfotelmatobacter sp.]